jgi:arylsulfatase A-like enzyme
MPAAGVLTLPLAAVAAGAAAAASQRPRPHLVFVMADDLGWANVGYHNAHAQTPHLDGLVRAGVELDRHYAYYYCGPTRASFLTGRYPAHVNEEFDDCTPQGTAPLKMTMIAAKLKLAGYMTHQIGKWGVGQASHRSLPRMRGFDTSFGYLGSAEDHFTHKNGGCGKQCSGQVPTPVPKHWGTDLWDDDRPASFDHAGQYSAVMYNQRVQSVLSQHDPDSPFFLYLAPQDAHGKDETLPQWSSLYNSSAYTTGFAVYNGMASAIDSLVANLTATLEAKGMWQRTLLVFSSDNGGPSELGKERNASNFPMRGRVTFPCSTSTFLINVSAFLSHLSLLPLSMVACGLLLLLLSPHDALGVKSNLNTFSTTDFEFVAALQWQVVGVGRRPPCRCVRLWWLSVAEHERASAGWLHPRVRLVSLLCHK